jgi:hypothetical protein
MMGVACRLLKSIFSVLYNLSDEVDTIFPEIGDLLLHPSSDKLIPGMAGQFPNDEK